MRRRPGIEARWRRDAEAITRCAFEKQLAVRIIHELETRLTVLGHIGVSIDCGAEPIGLAIDNSAEDHASVAVAKEDDIGQLLHPQKLNHVLDMCIEIDIRAEQVLSLSDACQGWSESQMAVGPKRLSQALEIPAAVPAAGDENESGYCSSRVTCRVATIPFGAEAND